MLLCYLNVLVSANFVSVHPCPINIIVTIHFLIKDAVKIYRSFMKYFLSQINSRFHVVSGIYIRQYVNSSLRVLTKMAKIGT